jgi:hypothetical protein
MMHPKPKDCMCIYSLKDLTKFTLSYNNSDSTSSKWLLSDDGNIIIRKIEDTLNVIILDRKNDKVYTSNNLDKSEYSDKTSVMLTTTKLDNNIMNTILLWDRVDYTFYLWGVVNYNDNIYISNRIKIRPDDTSIPLKTSTNGKLFVNIYKDHVNIVDITYLIPFPCIIKYCEILYADIRKQTDPVLSSSLLIGNNTSLKHQILTEKLRYILDPLITDDTIIMETHDTLTVPIIEKSGKSGDNIICTDVDLDSVDLFFTILNNVSSTLNIFRSLRGDELYSVKVNMFFSLLVDILLSLFNSNISDSVHYCRLCMLCTVLMYKYTDTSYDKKVADKLHSIATGTYVDHQ